MTVPARRVLAGLAVAAVPTLAVVAAAWYRYAVYADREARLYFLWSVPLLVVATLAGGTLVIAWFAGGGRWRRVSTVVAYAWAVAVLAWYVTLSVVLDWRLAPGMLACLPTTALSLVLFRRIERNRRVPWRLVLLPVLWGASVGPVYARFVTELPEAAAMRAMTPGAATPYANALVVAASEEAVKAVGVVVVLLVFRHRLHGLLGGLLVGAFVGAGFQFVEASLYMSVGGGADTMLYQYWMRQYTSLLTSHTVYSGLAGAGIGLAWQQRGVPWKLVSGVGGYLAAVAAHASWNAAASTGRLWLPDDAALHLFLAGPVNVLVLNGPFVVLYWAAVVCAQRFELRGLAAELLAEAVVDTGAVRRDEVRVVASASTRWRVRFARLRRRDVTGFLYVRALHAAQVDLGYARWRRARGEGDAAEESRARARVLRIRAAGPPSRTVAVSRPARRAGTVLEESPA